MVKMCIQEQWKDRKAKRLISFLIYIILVLSVFSDVLRIPGSAVTFFRLSLPFAVLILAFYPYWFLKYWIIISGLFFLSLVQYILFFSVIHPELDLSVNNFIQYLFFYSCAILVFFLVKILQMNNEEVFERRFTSFIVGMGIVLGGILLLYDILSKGIGGMQLDNPNNYACCMTAFFPFLLIQVLGKKKSRYLFLIILILGILVYSDAKAALFGSVLQIGVFLALFFESANKQKVLRWRLSVVGIGIIFLVAILILNPHINGYTIRGTILEPVERLVQNNPYPIYTTSITFRTNTTIFAIWELIHTAGIGLGMGNTGVLLKHTFTALNPEYQQAINATFLSLHNSWLEIALDIGIPVLVFYIIVFIYIFKLYFGKPYLTQVEKIRIVYTLSFPIWVIGPSGIYTLYFLLLTIAFLVFANKDALIVEAD